MTITIRQVDGRRGLARFVDVAWKVHSSAPSNWIPPLRMMVRGDLDDRGNPFYGGATRALFIAERGGRPVGRVTAIENRRHNEVHGDRVGFFGFFECIDDQEACDALMASAEGWLVGRGLDRARGPVNPSMHHECGLLVEGFEHAPAIMTPWSPPYYQSLLDRSGYVGERDLLGYYLPGGDKMRLPDRILRVAERKLQRTKLVFREWDFGTFEQEAHNVHTLYCEAWSGNWGFVPPTWEEFWHIAKDLKSVLHPKFAFVAEVEGETVGFVVIARDLNRVLRRIRSGRLWPWNIVRLFLGLPKVLSGRLVMLGLKREYRNRGFFSLVMYEIARRAAEIGAEGAEASWIVEDNQALISPLKALGFEPYKRWRIYEKVLNPDRT